MLSRSPLSQGFSGFAKRTGTPGLAPFREWDEADLEIECIHTGTGYTLFVFGIHTGYTL